jgi:hypothetical protein
MARPVSAAGASWSRRSLDAVMQLGVVVEHRRPIQQARSTSTSVTWISTSITEGGNPVLSATLARPVRRISAVVAIRGCRFRLGGAASAGSLMLLLVSLLICAG